MLSILPYDSPLWRQPDTPAPPPLEGPDAALLPPTGRLLLAYDPDTPHKILGSAGFVRISDTVCEARRVVVHWDYQHKGIGKQLLAALLAEAKRAGYTGIRAQLPDSVPELVTFFQRAGFLRSPDQFQTPGTVRVERLLTDRYATGPNP
jgi:GNAT superfamily N-acetyltransferase